MGAIPKNTEGITMSLFLSNHPHLHIIPSATPTSTLINSFQQQAKVHKQQTTDKKAEKDLKQKEPCHDSDSPQVTFACSIHA